MLAILAAAFTAASCNPAPGADRLWANPQTRIVLIGEAHGTHEIPALAGDILCAAAASGTPTVLALEADPRRNQAQVDAYLRSAGTEADRAALRAAPMWADPFARGSVAVLELVESARRLRTPVILFDTSPTRSGPTDGPREQGMAGALAAAASTGRVIALTGLGHADRTAFASLSPPVLSAIRRLPPQTTVSIAPGPAAGQVWSCRSGPRMICGPTDVPPRGDVASASLLLSPAARPGFDGVYAVGRPFSAAAPAAEAEAR